MTFHINKYSFISIFSLKMASAGHNRKKKLLQIIAINEYELLLGTNVIYCQSITRNMYKTNCISTHTDKATVLRSKHVG